jgi:hypothetical protein
LNSISKNDKFRNHDQDKGMMDVTMLKETNKTNRMFIEACQKNRFDESKDYNVEESLNEIVSISQISAKGGKPWSTASGCLLTTVKQETCTYLSYCI